jgi:hypothetical protein
MQSKRTLFALIATNFLTAMGITSGAPVIGSVEGMSGIDPGHGISAIVMLMRGYSMEMILIRWGQVRGAVR